MTKIGVKVLLLLFITGTSVARIHTRIPKLEEPSDLERAAISTVKTCHGRRVIGLAGNVSNSLISVLSSKDFLIPCVNSIVGADDSVNTRDPRQRKSSYQLNIFVIVVSSSVQLRTIFLGMKNSQWWNHMATFYILESSADGNGCSEAFESLWTAWKQNVLDAYFMCTNSSGERLVYTFNPYTTDTSRFWTLVEMYSGENNHPWTLFVQKYREGPGTCKKMFIERDKNLGGYEICATLLQGAALRKNVNESGIDSLEGPLADIVQSLFRTLNSTVKLLVHERAPYFIDGKGKVHGIVAEILDEGIDINLDSRPQVFMSYLPATYPLYQIGWYALTRYRGHESQIKKIATVIDAPSRIGVCLVCLVTLIILKFFMRQSWQSAILNVVRMICNAPLTDLSRSLSARFYLAALFIFLVTVQGIYQGKLASVLSNRKSLRNIDTIEDLAKSNNFIYYYAPYRNLIGDVIGDDRLVGTQFLNCTKYVLHNPSAACVTYFTRIGPDAEKLNLHLSRNPISQFYISWAIREDWPLERRFNKLIQRYVEGYHIYESSGKIEEKMLRRIRANDDMNEDKNQTLKVFTIDDLSFAFTILGCGLGCATIIFVVESVIGNIGSLLSGPRHFVTNFKAKSFRN